MLKRLSLVCSVTLAVGMIIWLSLGPSSMKVGAIENAQARIAKSFRGRNTTPPESKSDQLARESPRHAAGELKINQSSQFKRKQEEFESTKVMISTQIDTLSKYQGMQLYAYAAGLDLSVRELFPRYLEASRELDTFKMNGMGFEHPIVKAQIGKIAELNRDLDDAILNLRKTLSAQSGIIR